MHSHRLFSYGIIVPLLLFGLLLTGNDAYGSAENRKESFTTHTKNAPGGLALDDLIRQLRQADMEPSKAILAVHKHNKNFNQREKKKNLRRAVISELMQTKLLILVFHVQVPCLSFEL